MRNVIKGALIAAVAVMSVAAPAAVSAWGEAEYTGNGKPVFNTYTNVPNVGDESDFLKVGKVGAVASKFSNKETACEGELALTVYVHNGAPEGFNGTNNDGTGVAKDTKVQVKIPTAKSKNQEISAVISASNATSVTDKATISCNSDDIKVEYVANSAEVYTEKTDKYALSNDIVGNGALIGTYGKDGVVPGCWEFRNYVYLKVKVTKVPKVTPKPTPKPVTPAKTLVKTGPGDIAGIFVVTTIAGALAHKLVVSRKSSF